MRIMMEPGDLFTDAQGVAWVVNHPRPGHDLMAQLVYFTPESRGMLAEKTLSYIEHNGLSHPEGDSNVQIPLDQIPQPYKLIAELAKTM